MMLERMTLKDSEHAAYEARKVIALEAEKKSMDWLNTTAYISFTVKCAKCGSYLLISGQSGNTLLVDPHTCKPEAKAEAILIPWAEAERIGISRKNYDDLKAELVEALGAAGGVVPDGHTAEPTDEIPAPRMLGHERPRLDYFS